MPDYDIFCKVVDNYGDAGVCWRLARQLATEHGANVRLCIDDLSSLRMLCPQLDSASARQQFAGVQIVHWDSAIDAITPASIVIEAFGCGLPQRYIESMSAGKIPPLWIVLEYLSAEPWVREHHGLPSPHPRLALERYYFFPGFVAGTGGLLREADLCMRRDAFDTAHRQQFWESLGFELPPDGATVVSLFGYGYSPIGGLLGAWAGSDLPMIAAIPEGKTAGPVLEFLGVTAFEHGRSHRRGSLEVRMLPFVEQSDYDKLLWACDCNFVRGEDSFVRAQWAARPMIWQIYPQQEDTHWRKLECFLDLYCNELPVAAAQSVRALCRTWNRQESPLPEMHAAWRAFWHSREILDAHASKWANQLAEVGDLAGKLALFRQDRIK
jgi:uncharacterized repeat protein (TIGR03837 family)